MSEPTPLAGLIVAPGPRTLAGPVPVPLIAVQVRARITAGGVRVRVVQRYRNDESHPIEAVYVFPADEGAAICGFNVVLDGRRLSGRVLEREAAFEAYDAALAEGDGAYLIDEERPDIFTASIGNLKPGQTVAVEIEYVAELQREGDAIRFVLPTTVSPRYLPHDRRDFDGQTDAERVNPPTVGAAPGYRLDLQVDADLLVPVREVESPSHTIRSQIDGTQVRVSLAGGDDRLDRDFVLLLTPADVEAARSRIVSAGDGERFAYLSFLPEPRFERRPAEVVFVVDCSGSMQGSSIDEARRTLRLCLHALQPGDRFDIVRFGFGFDRLFGETRIHDDATLGAAEAWVAAMRADLGGTELQSPLRDVLESPPAKGMNRRLLLLTDGQVTDESRIFHLAQSHRDRTRIYAFGIGHGCSHSLVRGIARASDGAAEFVYPGERIDAKVMRHFRRMTSPTCRPTLSWERIEVDQVVPDPLPALSPGERYDLMARIVAGDSGRCRLVGELDGRALDCEANLESVAAASGDEVGDPLPLLWARRRMRDLEARANELADGGSRQVARRRGEPARAKQLREEQVALGVRYGLLSSQTSFVVIEERTDGEKTIERAVLRQVPQQLTRGWHGMTDASASGYDPEEASEFCIEYDGPIGPEKCRRISLSGLSLSQPDDASAPDDLGEADRSIELLSAHNADGSWQLGATVAEVCGFDEETLRSIASGLEIDRAEAVLATLLVLEWARSRPDDERVAFEPVLDRARDWLLRVTAGQAAPDGADDWQSWAGALWTAHHDG